MGVIPVIIVGAGADAEIVAGRLGVSFGRFAGLEPGVRDLLSHQPVRYEPMAVCCRTIIRSRHWPGFR